MNRFLTLIICLILVFSVSKTVFSQQNQGILPQIGIDQQDEQPDEDYYDYEEDDQTQQNQQQAFQGLTEEDIEEGEYGKDLVIDMVISLDYVMNEGGGFGVRYNVRLEGAANSRVAVVRGDAEIKTSVDGPLAKWDTGECTLNVTIPKVPFDMTFRRTGDEEGMVNLRFRGTIMENWSSECTFLDSPEAKFVTSGPPEKWLNQALQKASPPITSLSARLDPETETTATSTINAFTVEDQPIGNAEVQGKIVITVKPK